MKNAVRFILVFCVGCVLVFLSVQKLELQSLADTIQSASYGVVIPVFVISILGYWFRSLRWQIIMHAMGHSIKTGHLFSALSIGYAVNIATPRLGEVVRCMVLNKTDLIPVERSLVSVVVERVIDFVCLVLVILFATLLSFGPVRLFIQDNIIIPLFQKWTQLPLGWILVGLFVVGLLSYFGFKRLASNSRVEGFTMSILESIKQVIHLEQKVAFITYTLLIWICYFLMTFLWFFLFADTSQLGIKEALVIMAIGSVGRSVPVQGGGMGAYHFLVSNAFTLFGITLLMGNAMAFIIHGAQLLLTFVLGIGCWLWMLWFIRRTKE